MSNDGDALIVFAKNPVPGKVKTRIANSLGPEQAYQIYQQLLDTIRTTCLEVKAARYVFYSDYVDTADEWPSPPFNKGVQSGPDIGARMNHALGDVLRRHSRAVLVGSDVPDIKAHHLSKAFHLLEKVPVVIGPAADGGYYLIGLTQPRPELFQHINWSTSTVLDETLHRCSELSIPYRLLETLHDIDTADDWFSYLYRKAHTN
jgi:uncharacterized protein